MSKNLAILVAAALFSTFCASAVAGSCQGTFEWGPTPFQDYTWVGVPITISCAPSSAVVTKIDVHIEVTPGGGFLYVCLTDEVSFPDTGYPLIDGEYNDGDHISRNFTNITALNGKLVNQEWTLWFSEDYAFDLGQLESWSVTVYYDDGTVTSYCNASGGCDEYISNVQVGSINNSSSCDGYKDYTALSTNVTIGQSYPIAVYNGNPYIGDNCGIWVDWNHDLDFSDTGETISVSGNPGLFAGSITPPATAVAGKTTMRIRIGYGSSLSPCGNAQYGEVEDYSINVISAVQNIKISGYVRYSNSSPVPGVSIKIDTDGTNQDPTTVTNSLGYYEVTVPAPWSGDVERSKPKHYFNWGTGYTNITEDLTVNILAFYTYSGGTGNESDPFLISSAEDLNDIGKHPETWDEYFQMTNDIDIAALPAGSFNTIGSYGNPFLGNFDGAGFSVLNLKGNTGLFGVLRNAVIKNLGVEDVNITNAESVGALCSSNQGGTIENCFTTGSISAYHDAGGLCAWVHKEFIQDPPIPTPTINTPTIRSCYSTVNITLVHPNHFPGFSKNCAGGLCGYAQNANILNNYALGSVDATGIKTPLNNITIDNGGLIGYSNNSTVAYNYSAAYVVKGRPYSNPAGFCGKNSASQFFYNYWNVSINPLLQGISNALDSHVTAKTTSQMLHKSTFDGLDFSYTWKICEGTNYPKLKWQTPLAGDFTCPDGVNFKDFSLLANAWIAQQGQSNWNPVYNLNNDNVINFKDLSVFADNWLADN